MSNMEVPKTPGLANPIENSPENENVPGIIIRATNPDK